MYTFRKIFTALAFIFIVSNINAQQIDKRGTIGVSLGLAFPAGNFGKTDLSDSLSGLATTGALFQLSFDYRIGHNLGIAAVIRGQSNPINESSIKNVLLILSTSAQIESENWKITNYLAGLYATLPTSSTGKVSFDVRFLACISHVTSPRLKITINDLGISVWSEQLPKEASSFGLLVGAGLRFNVSESISILTNADMLFTEPEFNDVQIRTSSGAVDQTHFRQSITTFNMSLGVGFRLN